MAAILLKAHFSLDDIRLSPQALMPAVYREILKTPNMLNIRFLSQSTGQSHIPYDIMLFV